MVLRELIIFLYVAFFMVILFIRTLTHNTVGMQRKLQQIYTTPGRTFFG